MLILTILLTLTTAQATQDLFPQAHQPLPAGRLVLSLNEGDTIVEQPARRTIGPLTRRTAAAIEQQAGIIVISPSVWHSLMHHRLAFNQNSAHLGSAAHRLTSSWQDFTAKGTDESFAELYQQLKAHQQLLWHLFIWQLKLTAENWSCYLHRSSGMIVLVPQAYLNERLTLLPRWLPNAYTPEEYATGLHLSSCEHLELPAHNDETAYRRHLHRIKQVMAQRELSAEKLTDIFLSRTKLQHQMITTWHICALGHGAADTGGDPWQHLSDQSIRTGTKSRICGISLPLFRSLLLSLNHHLAVSFFHYHSCFAPGQQLAQLYAYNVYSRPQASNHLDLSFPLVAGAFIDGPQPTLPEKYHHASFARCLELLIDTNLPRFFDLLDKPQSSLREILTAITPQQTGDLHAIGNIPLLLAPHSTVYEPIDLVPAHAQSGSPQVVHLSTTDQVNAQQERILKNSRAALISTFRIAHPLTLYSYRSQDKALPGLLAPALISIIPGNAIHHFSDLTAHKINLQSLLMHSFMQLTQQYSTKVYLIDRLTIDNDLPTHFTREETTGFFYRLFAALTNWMVSEPLPLHTPTITREKVVIVVHNDLLECYFLEPLTGGKRAARHTQFRLLSSHGNTPIARKDLHQAYANSKLTLTKVGTGSHTNLWKKYTTLFERQSPFQQLMGRELSPTA